MERSVLIEKGAADVQSEPQVVAPPKLPLPPKAEADRPTPGTRRLVFALSEGDVALTVPEDLSAESVEDLDAYLEVFMRKARRESGLSGPKSG